MCIRDSLRPVGQGRGCSEPQLFCPFGVSEHVRINVLFIGLEAHAPQTRQHEHGSSLKRARA
eukprot:14423324-Alexandrium_andersonii.AAC.1